MPDFSAKKPGDPSPAKSADWITAVSAATSAYLSRGELGSSKGAKPAGQVDRAAVKVKNLTGSDLVRGNYVQLGDFELDARDPRKMWFEGNLYDEAVSNRIAIVTNAVKSTARVDAVLIGVAVAVVDVTDTDHRFAVPVDDDYTLTSTATGAIEILDTVTSTGEQECAVLLGAGSAGTANIGMALLTSDVAPAVLGTNHITLGEGSAKELQQDDGDDATSWGTVGDAFTIYSKNPVLIRSGRVVTYQMHGNLEAIKIINDKDCG